MDLQAAVDGQPVRPFEGIVYRVYNPTYGFFETIGSYLNGGRWNLRGFPNISEIGQVVGQGVRYFDSQNFALAREKFLEAIEQLQSPRKGFGALYTSLQENIAVEEARRQFRKRNLSPEGAGPRTAVQIRVRLTRAIDLSSLRFYADIGKQSANVLGDDVLCLKIADQVRQLDCEAVVVPSVIPEGINLVLYLDKLRPGWMFEEVYRQSITL